MSVELGVVREAWLAPTDDHVTNKNSFLVRDDAYVVQEATFGRQVRLGSPIDLGPDSSWNQDGWFGGADQETWFDKFMYEEGSADTSDRNGRIKMWGGWRHLVGTKSRPGTFPAVMTPGGTGFGEWDTPLIVAERHDDLSATAAPVDGYALYAALPNNANAAVHNFAYGVRAIGPSGNELGSAVGQYLIGTADGRLWKYDQSTHAVTEDPASPGFGLTQFDNQIGIDCIKGYNGATFYGRGRELYRRDWGGSGNATHTLVKHLGGADELRSLIVWQNRLWFLGLSYGGRTTLYTSDGVTVVAVLELPHGFIGYSMVAHYGSLYIGGAVNITPGGQQPGSQVWRYNGFSLTKLWDADDRDEGTEGFHVMGLTSWDRFVAWSRHGTAADPRAGVWLYDAEEDAVLEGPTLDLDPAASTYQVTQVTTWANTLAIAVRDRRTITASTYDYPWVVAFLRRDGAMRLKENTTSVDFAGQSFGYEPTVITRHMKSSAYNADLIGVNKVWLTGWVRCKVPEDTRVRIAVATDGGSETVVATITYDAAQTGWRNERFSLVDGSDVNLRGETLNYTVYVEHLDDTDVESTANPEVSFVGFQFRQAADKRRMWHVRVYSTDGQNRLDGTANPLATRDAIVAKLMELWSSNDTLSFWEASADGATSGGGADVRVTMSAFTDQPYRVSMESDEVMSETSFTLLEVLD